MSELSETEVKCSERRFNLGQHNRAADAPDDADQDQCSGRNRDKERVLTVGYPDAHYCRNEK